MVNGYFIRVMAILFTIHCSLFTASAQNAQVASIRKLYAEVKQEMENRKKPAIKREQSDARIDSAEREQAGPKVKAELPPNETVVTSNYMAPGGGPTKDVTHYYYNGEFDENLGNVFYTPCFITRKYNVGARNYYEEFLFDKGSLVFFFCKSQNDETRYYWGANGFLHEVIKGQRQMDEVFAARLAGDLKAAFDKLMNREY